MKTRWIQRDLEEQIAEEYKNQGKEYQFLNQKKEKMAQELKISEILTLLKQGYKRWTKEENEEGKSIQTHYGLTFSECKEIFKHPKIKGLKSKKLSVKLIDDTEINRSIVQAETTTWTEAEVVAEQPTTPVEQTLEEKFENLFN
jgi:hypothetical protein